MARDLTKEQWKELAKEFAGAYLDVLVAVGSLDPQNDEHWITLQNKAHMLLRGNLYKDKDMLSYVDSQIYSALKPLFDAFALTGNLRSSLGNTACFAKLHTSTTPSGAGTPAKITLNYLDRTVLEVEIKDIRSVRYDGNVCRIMYASKRATGNALLSISLEN